ncbi:hypothetical protein [Aliikangiella sp. IMCC44359]|uniref:hypothetical protein n=1 Tax=Aliikangiella sp. IMCC44359 TaxID=3459125 RepID=UPI00403A7E8D
MDFEELKNESHQGNVKKNRVTLVALFAVFMLPVLIAYSAYFSGWFSGATKNRGTLLTGEQVLDIEDFTITRADGNKITGKEFETLYWWILPINPSDCNSDCVELNTFTLNQTYIGLGKETQRIKQLLILPEGTNVDNDVFPTAFSSFTDVGLKANSKTHSGLNKDLPSGYIYLVDPLGNIIIRYPLVNNKEEAPKTSKDIRSDLKRLFKYSRLG